LVGTRLARQLVGLSADGVSAYVHARLASTRLARQQLVGASTVLDVIDSADDLVKVTLEETQ